MPTRKLPLGLVLWSGGIIGLLATGCSPETMPTSLPTPAPTSISTPAATPASTAEATLMPTNTLGPTYPPTPTNVGGDRPTVVGVESLGIVTFETGTMFGDTELGGLSGITYDSNREMYYALSDDRSETNPARYYEVAIDISDHVLEEGDVTFLAVTTLRDQSGSPFASRSVDPEGITLSSEGILYISSEGDADETNPNDPFVNEFNLNGQQTKALPVPDKFVPDSEESFGVRDNLAFESLGITPGRESLYTASENALAQDGPISDLDQESLSRIIRYSLSRFQPMEEFVYATGAIPAAPNPPEAFSDNGLVELVALDNNGTLLALERSFAVGVGNTIRLYEVLTTGATDVSGIDDLFDEDTGTPVDFIPVDKRLLVDFGDMGLTPDNVEGMTLGPILPDGRRTLILVSDNNFNADQVTQFIVLALEL